MEKDFTHKDCMKCGCSYKGQPRGTDFEDMIWKCHFRHYINNNHNKPCNLPDKQFFAVTYKITK